MDSADKIEVFKSFEELTQKIIQERDTNEMLAQRYAVRFIMLNNFDEFKNLAKFMANIGVDSLDLETLIDEGEDDTWITIDTLKQAIKDCKNSAFITPFSELVRFYNDVEFRGFFNEIMLLEDIYNPKKRIYIPLIGLQNRFSDFLNHFARIQESAPIWRYDAEPQAVEVFFAKYKDFKVQSDKIKCQLNSLREWLRFWKVQAPQKRIVCTSLPIAAKYKYSKPDNIFNFTKIGNAYDFMTQFLELKFPFAYLDNENEHWEQLLKCINDVNLLSFSFETFVRNYFNKVTLNASDLLHEWLSSGNSTFERWLLMKYALFTSFNQSNRYLVLCFDSVTDLSDAHQLPLQVATRIVYEPQSVNQSKFSVERRNIIVDNSNLFNRELTGEEQKWLFDRIKDLFNNQSLDTALEICTGIFDFEKVLLIGWYAHQSDNSKLKSTIERLYPEFNAYLATLKPSDFKTNNQWAIDYIKAYKSAKLKDKYTDEIKNFIVTKNHSSASFYEWYYEFEESHSQLADIDKNPVYRPDRIFWIDGLGAEFLSYVLYLIESADSNLKVVRSYITRSVLPSSTHHNRFEGERVTKYGALDELGHDSHMYKYITTLKDELKTIKTIINEIISESKKQPCTIAIVSDHGLSCLSRKAPSKKYDGKFEHEGRYMKASEDALSDSDFLIHDNENDGQKYKVALTHSSLSKVPTHQVHGGCTPEEILVPFILLSNKNVTTQVKYQVNVSGEDIMLSNPSVSVTIIPEPKSVELTCEGKTYKMDRIGTKWTTLLHDITEGKHSVDIKPEGASSIECEIKVIGIGGESNINDFFEL